MRNINIQPQTCRFLAIMMKNTNTPLLENNRSSSLKAQKDKYSSRDLFISCLNDEKH